MTAMANETNAYSDYEDDDGNIDYYKCQKYKEALNKWIELFKIYRDCAIDNYDSIQNAQLIIDSYQQQIDGLYMMLGEVPC